MTGRAAVGPGTGAARFRILVLCTANICRSPAAEVLLTRLFGGSTDVRVASAGLDARTGRPVAEEMTRLLGGPVDGFAAQQVTVEMIAAADLVLVMTRRQRSAVADAAPAAVRRTFTLREFADLAGLAQRPDVDLLGATPGERLAALTALAPRLRSLRPTGERDDIDDPYGLDEQAYARAMAQIEDAVGDIVAVATTAPAGHR
jgi:protein-tyrosine phosphatase